VILLLALGFVPALILSGVFELTPDGHKRDADVEVTRSIAPQTARQMDRMLLVVMALALGYFAVDKFVLAPPRLLNSATQLVTPASTVAIAATPTTAPAQTPVESQSIAVLAFADLSPNKDQEYCSDGVAEEILNALAKVEDLKVAGSQRIVLLRGPQREPCNQRQHAGRGARPGRLGAQAGRAPADQREAAKDPFDRMLVAQAIQEPMVLLTRDRQITAYSELVRLV